MGLNIFAYFEKFLPGQLCGASFYWILAVSVAENSKKVSKIDYLSFVNFWTEFWFDDFLFCFFRCDSSPIVLLGRNFAKRSSVFKLCFARISSKIVQLGELLRSFWSFWATIRILILGSVPTTWFFLSLLAKHPNIIMSSTFCSRVSVFF